MKKDYIEMLRVFWGDKNKADTMDVLHSAIWSDWTNEFNDETLKKGFKNCEKEMLIREACTQLVLEGQISEKEYQNVSNKLDVVLDKFMERDDIFISLTDKTTGKKTIVSEKAWNNYQKQQKPKGRGGR